MKYLILALFSFVAIVAQSIAGHNFFFFNFLDLSLLLVTYWALYRSRTQALFVGSLAGILLDAALGWPLGYNGFGKTLAAFVIGQAAKRFNLEGLWVRFVLIAASSCVSSLSIYILLIMLQRTASRVYPGASLLQAFITAGVGVLSLFLLETYTRAQANRTG